VGGSLERGTTRLCPGALLSLIYINDLEEDAVSIVFKFADDTKLFRQVRDAVATIGMQKDAEDLERLVDGLINGKCNLM